MSTELEAKYKILNYVDKATDNMKPKQAFEWIEGVIEGLEAKLNDLAKKIDSK